MGYDADGILGAGRPTRGQRLSACKRAGRIGLAASAHTLGIRVAGEKYHPHVRLETDLAQLLGALNLAGSEATTSRELARANRPVGPH
jgi:hypothetical protein